MQEPSDFSTEGLVRGLLTSGADFDRKRAFLDELLRRERRHCAGEVALQGLWYERFPHYDREGKVAEALRKCAKAIVVMSRDA